MVKKSIFVQHKIGQSQLFNLVAIFGVIFALLSAYLFGMRNATGRITYNVCQGTSPAFQVLFDVNNNILHLLNLKSEWISLNVSQNCFGVS